MQAKDGLSVSPSILRLGRKCEKRTVVQASFPMQGRMSFSRVQCTVVYRYMIGQDDRPPFSPLVMDQTMMFFLRWWSGTRK